MIGYTSYATCPRTGLISTSSYNAVCFRHIFVFVNIHEFLKKRETTVVSHSPYSSDLAPADIFLFPKWKSLLKGRRFQRVQEI